MWNYGNKSKIGNFILHVITVSEIILFLSYKAVL